MAEKAKPKIIYVNTRDGWRLALYRHAAGVRGVGFGPVLLVHGLGANHYNMDAPDPRISLAAYLRERGHDVWLVDLRGAGKSRRRGWPLRRRAQYDFDDYVHRDVPAILRTVLDCSGADSLHWVGHSMGGMLAYAALEHFDQTLFRSVTTIGSPAFTKMKHPVVDRLYKLRFMLKVLPWLPYRRGAYLGSFFPRTMIKLVGDFAGNTEHLDPAHVRLLSRAVIEDLPARLVNQFAEWYGGERGFSRMDGLLDYYSHLDRITAPMLIIAGAGDGLTPPEDLRWVYKSISSDDKRYIECGKAQGYSLDYGHIDLVLGTRARDEVYPHVSQWIEEH